MFSVERLSLPSHSLLYRYKARGAFVDCYYVDITCPISQSMYIEAFYTTPLFKLERWILTWLVSRPSTDQQASLLSMAKITRFSAWRVEKRSDNQLLMCDYRERTRSWLMSEPSKGGVRLYFGSAVVPDSGGTEESQSGGFPKMGNFFKAIQWFHHLYSMALLASARSRLLAQLRSQN